MTIHTRTRQIGATPYYLGRPAAFWLTVLAPRRQRTSHRATRPSWRSDSGGRLGSQAQQCNHPA
jgi:hypothetical protein